MNRNKNENIINLAIVVLSCIFHTWLHEVILDLNLIWGPN